MKLNGKFTFEINWFFYFGWLRLSKSGLRKSVREQTASQEVERYIAKPGLISPFPPLWFSNENGIYFVRTLGKGILRWPLKKKLNLAFYFPLHCKSEQRLKWFKGLVFIFAFFILAQDRFISSTDLFASVFSEL